MGKAITEAVRQAIVATVFRHLDAREWRLFLFGSFARGAADRASDIDLAIEGPVPLAPAAAAHILAELEETVPCLRGFDLVDLRTCSAPLRARVQTEGIAWHP